LTHAAKKIGCAKQGNLRVETQNPIWIAGDRDGASGVKATLGIAQRAVIPPH